MLLREPCDPRRECSEFGVTGGARAGSVSGFTLMEAVEVEEVVAALNERGFIANVHRPRLNRVCVRIVLPGGAEALWDADGASGLEAQVMADGMLVGFVPTIPGSASFDVAQTVEAIAGAKYIGGVL